MTCTALGILHARHRQEDSAKIHTMIVNRKYERYVIRRHKDTALISEECAERFLNECLKHLTNNPID